jgi:hypothetical protein
MYATARNVARRRLVVVVTALLVIGATAPAAVAKTAKARPAPPKRPPRTGLIVSICSFSHRSLDDPIVFPGQPGKSHSHDFFGNATTSARSTPASLAGHSTTCDIAGDTAAYWAPTLDVNGAVVRPLAAFAYYAVFGNQKVHTLPMGLKMLAGGNGKVHFSCFRHSMPTAQTSTIRPCAPGEQMAVGINFPNCWNGTSLDSTDHRSHMAYQTGGTCPAGYPVVVPRLGLWVTYKAVPRGSLVTLSSGLMNTAHADYVNSWNPHTLASLESYCLTGHRECYKEMGQVLKKLHLPHNKI